MPKSILQSLAAAWLVPSLLSASESSFSRFPSGEPLEERHLTSAMCRGWVEVRTGSASQLLLWDLLLEIDGASRILLGCNRDYLYALSLAGGFRSGGQRVPAGSVALWTHLGGTGGGPSVYPFSAAQLQDVFAAQGYGEDPDLAELARDEPPSEEPGTAAPVLASPLSRPAGPESGAAVFRTSPEIIAIKRASRHAIDYGYQTAKQFLTALAAQDHRLVAVLLAPSLFREASAGRRGDGVPLETRLQFARRIASTADYSRLDLSTLRDRGEHRYEVSSSDATFRLTLRPFEDGLYVSRLDTVSR